MLSILVSKQLKSNKKQKNVDKRNRFWENEINLIFTYAQFWLRFDYVLSLRITYYVERCVWTLFRSRLRNSERKNVIRST